MIRRFSNKIGAFTLFETIQTLILVSILVTILGSTFFYIYRYHNGLSEKLAKQGSLHQLGYLVLEDYADDRYFEYTGESLFFESDSVTYLLGSEVIRNQGLRVDTFKVSGSAEEMDGMVSLKFFVGTESLSLLLESEKPFVMEEASTL